MIWQFNPKKHVILIPDAKLTIPCIKTLKKAHEVMDSAFDPTAWQYVVVSKSGTQLHNFATRENAEADALRRCTKTATFVVYENGKPVTAYINAKRLPDYKTVWWKNTYAENGTNKHIEIFFG